MFCGLTAAIDSTFAQTWTQTSAPSAPEDSFWLSIASSADGSKLVAAADFWASYPFSFSTNSGFASTNSGDTWVLLPNPAGTADRLFFVTLSADGTKLAATSMYGFVYTSTNFGVTWTSNSLPSQNLIAIASSADGDKLVTVVGMNPFFALVVWTNGPIYVSTNSGAAWTVTSAPTNYWSCVASSADGTTLAAGTIGLNSQGYPAPGYLYVSTNAGATWLQTCAPTNEWSSIASSADGTKLAAVAPWASIYTSADSGATWHSNNVPAIIWQAITVSADGTKLAALDQYGHVYTSTNFGASWASNGIPTQLTCWGMASSADGNMLVAIVLEGGIWVSQATPSPQLNIMPAGGNCTVSWLVPSTNFVLQQNLDLTTTDWVTLTNTPMLNFTNLDDEVTLSPTNSSGFYRLVSQ